MATLIGFGFPPGRMKEWLCGSLHQRLAHRPCSQCAVPVWAATRVGSDFAPEVASLGLEPPFGAGSFISLKDDLRDKVLERSIAIGEAVRMAD